ncbi:MAG: Asp-tRNA(Asn)/Glu-tRNA(Gln) amidotransferase subunit GatC [Clostridia bacterium]|nr:Asp-tRNA(Asn)/Glu-tRNA(Gln) amidotransferase subunit GatC [Clostridia bacterium]
MEQNEKKPFINVEAVAELARLSLNDAERTAMGNEMAAIVAFAHKLSELDCENVPITAHVEPLFNVMREDKTEKSTERDALLRGAPTKAEGYFTVPRVVES